MLALAVAALLAAGPADSVRRDTSVARAALPPDRWLGEDKVKHFFLDGFTLATSVAAARAVGVERRPALVVGASVAALVGVGKEIRDRRVTGRFSPKDLLADALGAAAYGAVLARTF